MLHQALGHDAARGIAGAEKQDIKLGGVHDTRLRGTALVIFGCGPHWTGEHAAASPPQQFFVKKPISEFMALKSAE
jgi:hypothetical protein